jgi:REP element-mobilizing transposase RayT
MNIRIYFFTATILYWKKILTDDRLKDIIISSLKFLVENNRVKVYAFVIMPNHIHLIWKILEPHILQEVQRDFLKYTAQQIKFEIRKIDPDLLKQFKVEAKDREYQIWERNPLSVELISQKVLVQKLDYIHGNPVQEKWELCEDFLEYKYSSARFYYTEESEWDFLSHYGEYS